MVAKGASLCKGKSVKNPNRCKKVQGCKVAKGAKRSFCRKSQPHSEEKDDTQLAFAIFRSKAQHAPQTLLVSLRSCDKLL